MDYNQVTIFVGEKGVEDVCAILYSNDVSGVEIVEDEAQVKRHLEETSKYWDYADYEEIRQMMGEPCVRVYLADNAAGLAQYQRIEEQIRRLKEEHDDYGSLTVNKQLVSDGNWAESWKKYFRPIEVGEHIIIKPVWEEIPPTDKLVYLVDNSNIFGTGQHQTTRMCAEQLDKIGCQGKNVLDLGCGSGILSILALMMGAESAVAVDIEKYADKIAYENAALNGVDCSKYTVLVGDVLEDRQILEQIGYGKYDIVVANIVADVVIALCKVVPKQIKKGGTFITSGIIKERLPEVERALQDAGFKIAEENFMDGWCAITSKF